ncbi:MAG: hypothetical protein ACI85K_001649 [Hyphomicrobiaceae bacterium]|jgi:hypothetical protein
MNETSDSSVQTRSAAQRLLPTALWELPLARLRLDGDLADEFAARGLFTVGDALELSRDAMREGGAITPDEEAVLQTALQRALADGLRQFDVTTSTDWPTLRAQLLGPLDDIGRRTMIAAVGIAEPVLSRPALRQLLGEPQLDEGLHHIRQTLMEHSPALMRRMQDELECEFEAFDGVLYPDHAAAGSVAAIVADGCEDPELGLRLLAFCLPHRCHLHRSALHGIAPRLFRHLLRTLPQLVPQHRLPLPIDTLLIQLSDRECEVPRGVLIHVLRTELRTAVEIDDDLGEVAVPDPRTPAARLTEMLVEIGQPTTLIDLVFAYRERFRFASEQRLLRHLSSSDSFVRVARDTWSLRQWQEQALTDCSDLVDQIARRISTAESRQNVLTLVQEEHDEQTAWLVLDQLASDPRVRLLGRGEACAKGQTQSSVMRRLHRAFRRAAGDVVKSLFISNQPEAQRRLILRLLDHNRAFVQVSEDRIDTLINYPFSEERMQRLTKLVLEHLQKRTGYAQIDALLTTVNDADLGGRWLTPRLLADVLRRNGPFEILTPGIVALKDLSLPSILMRSARQALRAAGEAVTIQDVVRARPDLAEFTHCLAELLQDDPLVQTPDGKYFILA